MPVALTIAGSDPSGGAGLQADLKTFSIFKVYGMSAVTALTIGNTIGVTDMISVDPSIVSRQIKAVVEDIPPQSIKTGLLGSEETIRRITDELKKITCTLIVDPVMATKRGDVLASKAEALAYREHLLPLADVVTPNIPEAELLAEMEIHSPEQIPVAAKRILQSGRRSVVNKQSSGQSPEVLNRKKFILYLNKNLRFSNFPL